jgi:hypothetical protein
MHSADLPHRPVNPPPRYRGWAALGLALALSGCVVAPRHEAPRTRPLPPAQAPGPQASADRTLYFYPERGQPELQQDRDRYECYRWAVRETGTDPGMTPVRQVPAPVAEPPAQRRRDEGASVVAGAATGAVLGAAVSSPRHAGENAVIGGIFGAALGAAAAQAPDREADYRRPPPGAAPRPQASPALHDFRRAMGACMQGRGYRVG